MKLRSTLAAFAGKISIVLLACTSTGLGSVHATVTVAFYNPPLRGSSPFTLYFNNFTETVQADTTSTVSSLASAFAAKFSKDYLSQGLYAAASGAVINFALKSGGFGQLKLNFDQAFFSPVTLGFPTPPIASAGGPYTGSAGVPLTLAGSASSFGGDTLSYEWTNPLGYSITQLAPVVTFRYPGVYPLSFYAFDGNTYTESDTTVTIRGGLRTIPITNMGNASTTINNISITGPNASDFTLYTQNCPNPGVLAVGQSCSVQVVFVPGDAGPKQASVTITQTGATPIITIQLTGQN